jgi:5-methyltetrahydrofolate--homocysteine methyltransferase
MLMGTDAAGAATTLEAFEDVDVIGLNCGTGPQEMSEHVRYLSRHCSRFLAVLPNAGLPQVVDGKAHFPLTPNELARWLRAFVEVNGVNVVGGCCGTTPAHLQAVVEAVGTFARRERSMTREPSISSLYQAVAMRQDTSFLIVGERCNANGSAAFRRRLLDGDIEGLVEIGSQQIREGAHVLDVCVDCVGRDGVADMNMVVDRFAGDLTAPLMLDSTQAEVIEAGLKLAGGKCIVNSVNLEDGGTRLAQIARLLRQYGAAVVALTIDDDPEAAMAKTCRRKLSIARRLHHRLTCEYGVAEEDIFFDCLTFPVSTGNPEDRRLALETLEAVAAITQEFPRCQTILGVSNVSFGLSPVARVVLNSAFLHEAVQRGLTAAIVHAKRILPQTQISDQRWEAALDLIYDRQDKGEPLERFLGLFTEGDRIEDKTETLSLPVEERLRRWIIEGRKQNLAVDLDEALQRYSALEIINYFLLDAMKEVGELFGAGRMQLPFVLRSAEVMKAAMAHLEPHLEHVAGYGRGKIVLATVRGDVHDIGKNLADIILSNNGYTVYNLGIKQPIGNIIAALKAHGADAIGLSGLLVKSTLVMREDLEVLNERGIRTPVILGGAALNRRYVEEDLRTVYEGEVSYAKDAFEGLRLMNDLMTARISTAEFEEEVAAEEGELALAGAHRGDPPARPSLQETEQRYGLRSVGAEQTLSEPVLDEVSAGGTLWPPDETSPPTTPRRIHSDLGHEYPVPRPPFWGRRVLGAIKLDDALAYMNEKMLFQVQWGFRKKGLTTKEWRRYVEEEVRPVYRDLVARCEREDILHARAVYGYWPANSDQDDLIVFAPPTGTISRPEFHGDEIARFRFPRQQKHPYWCLSDFWRPVTAGVPDIVACSLVTIGHRASEVARQWHEKGEYRQYLYLHGLGVEAAEALAEYVHGQVRIELGVASRDARNLQRLFKQGYQGSRYSFGYPACPNLEDQRKLLRLLDAGRIGVSLTEGYQLEPEQSTTAIITYHPEARYFGA